MKNPRYKLLPLAIIAALAGQQAMAVPTLDTEPDNDTWAGADVVNISSFEATVGENDPYDFFRINDLTPGSAFQIRLEWSGLGGPYAIVRAFDPATDLAGNNIDLIFPVISNTSAPFNGFTLLTGLVPDGGVLGLRAGDGDQQNSLEGYRITLVPAPATVPLAVIGLAALAGLRRRQRRNPKQ